jgi:hypothetical protein
MEHRWGQRKTVDMSVHILHGGCRFATANLLNVSLSGAFIETELELIPLARLSLEIDLPNHTAAGTLRIGAFVVRRGGSGYGIEWYKAPAMDARIEPDRGSQHFPGLAPPSQNRQQRRICKAAPIAEDCHD